MHARSCDSRSTFRLASDAQSCRASPLPHLISSVSISPATYALSCATPSRGTPQSAFFSAAAFSSEKLSSEESSPRAAAWAASRAATFASRADGAFRISSRSFHEQRRAAVRAAGALAARAQRARAGQRQRFRYLLYAVGVY